MITIIALIIIQSFSYQTSNLGWQHITCYLYQDCLIPIQIYHNVYHGQVIGKDSMNTECKFTQNQIEKTSILSVQSNTNLIESIGINQKYYWYIRNLQILNLVIFNKFSTQTEVTIGKINYEYHQIVSIMTKRYDKILIFTGNQYWISNLKEVVYQDRKLQTPKQLISHASIDSFIIFIYNNQIELFQFDSELRYLHSLVFNQSKFIDVDVQKFNDSQIVYVLNQKGDIVVFIIQNNQLILYDKQSLNISYPKKIDVIQNYVYVIDSIKDLYDYAIKFQYKFVQKNIILTRYFMKNQLINNVIGLDSSLSVLVGDFFHRIIKTDFKNLTIKNNLNTDLYIEREVFDIKIEKINDSKFQLVGYNQTHFFVDRYNVLQSKLICKSDKQLVLNYDIQLLSTSCDGKTLIQDNCKITKSIMITYQKEKSRLEQILTIFIEMLIFIILFGTLLAIFYLKIKQKKQRLQYFEQKIQAINIVQCVQVVQSDISPKQKKNHMIPQETIDMKDHMYKKAYSSTDVLSSIATPMGGNYHIDINV